MLACSAVQPASTGYASQVFFAPPVTSSSPAARRPKAIGSHPRPFSGPRRIALSMICLPYFMQAPPMGFKKERVQRMQKMKSRQESSETGEPETKHPASTTSRATQELRSSRKLTFLQLVQESGPCWEETFGVRLRVTLTYKSGLHAANTRGRRIPKTTTTEVSTFQTLCPATSEEEDRTQIKERTFVAHRAQTPSKISSHQCNRSQTLRVTQLSHYPIARRTEE